MDIFRYQDANRFKNRTYIPIFHVLRKTGNSKTFKKNICKVVRPAKDRFCFVFTAITGNFGSENVL